MYVTYNVNAISSRDAVTKKYKYYDINETQIYKLMSTTPSSTEVIIRGLENLIIW